MTNRTEPADFCPTCGVRRYVQPGPSDYVAALPATGWSAHFWKAPNDPASMETRTEPLGGWGVTRTGEVYPLLISESPDVTIEDAGDDFAFIARAAAPRRELNEIRREAHAERERQRKPLESGGTG
jgi:hypothetical protein